MASDINWTENPVRLGKKAFATIQNAINDLNVRIGQLADLDTTDKTNVVEAVNEAHMEAVAAQAQVNALEEELKPFLMIGSYTFANTSIPAGSQTLIDASTSNIPEGYTAIAILGVGAGGDNYLTIRSANAKTGQVAVYNASTSAVSGTPYMNVICVKSSFFSASI